MSCTVPAALSALTDGFTSVLPVGYTVAEGTLVDEPKDGFLIVGWTQDAQIPAVSGGWTIQNAAISSDREDYDVLFLLGEWSGDDSTARATRALLFTHLGLMRAWLTANRSLADVVSQAYITDFSLQQTADTLGVADTLRFTVHVTAFTE